MKLLALVLVAACGRDTKAILEAPPRGSAAAVAKPAAPGKKLEGLVLTLPAGWTQTYAAATDSWALTDGTAKVRIGQLSAAIDPTPESYLELVAGGSASDITATQKLADGFALGTAHETYVLRHLGSTWLACESAWTGVTALCSSAKL